MITALASYYTEIKQPAKYVWLKEKLIRLKDSRIAPPLIVMLGKYLAVISDEKSQADGLNLLKKLILFNEVAKEHTSNQLIRSLTTNAQSKRCSALLNELKAN